MRIPRNQLLALFGGLLFVVSCDPPPGDGVIDIQNKTATDIGVVSYPEFEGELTIDEMIEAEKWVANSEPGDRQGYDLDTYLGIEEGKWCAVEMAAILLPLDGEGFGPHRLTSEDAGQFEVVKYYGPGICVDSGDAVVAFEG